MKILLLLPLFFAYGYCKLDLVKKLKCSGPHTLPGAACKGAFKRYTYDKEKGCVPFLYGGCRATKNNFETLEECIKTCGKPIQPRTTVVKVTKLGLGSNKIIKQKVTEVGLGSKKVIQPRVTLDKVIQSQLHKKKKEIPSILKKAAAVDYLRKKNGDLMMLKEKDMQYLHKKNEDMTMFRKSN